MSLPTERHLALISLLQAEGILSVQDLCERLRFSEATIRRDLRHLELTGQIIRVRGGAMYNDGTRSEPPFAVRRHENRQSKQRIALAAANYIKDGDTVFLDSSTTTAELIPYLSSRVNITVITCGMYAATLLSEQSKCQLVITGGTFNTYTGCMTSQHTLDCIDSMYVDKFFFSAQAVDAINDITDISEEVATVKQHMLARARESFFMCDINKFGHTVLCRVARLSEVDHIITTPSRIFEAEAWKPYSGRLHFA